MEEVEYEPLVYRHYTMEEFLKYLTSCLDKYSYSKMHVNEMIQEFLNEVNSRLTLNLDSLLFPYLIEHSTAIRVIKRINIYGSRY